MIATVLVILILITGAEIYSRKTLLGNIETRALSEVSEEAAHYGDSVEQFLDLKFQSLDLMAAAVGSQSGRDLRDYADMVQAFMKSHNISGLGYADIEGNIVSSLSIRADLKEKLSGSIADRSYFKKASSWQGTHALQYLPNTAITDDSRVILAVPVAANAQIDGVLFGSMEAAFFDELIWRDLHTEAFDLMLVDSDGTIISTRSDRVKNDSSVFDSLVLASDAEKLRGALQKSKDIAFELTDADCYLGCKRLGVEDWYMVCTLGREEAETLYASNLKAVSRMTSIISWVFGIGMGLIFLIYLILEHCNHRKLQVIQNYSARMRSFLEESGRMSFNFDVKEQKLSVSDALETFLQYSVPENWYGSLSRRKELHPEFDYQAVMAAYNDILIDGDYHEVVTPIETGKDGQRWIRISMTGSRDDNEIIENVFGTVADVTEEYLDSHLAKKERDYLFDAIYSFVPIAVSANLTNNSYTMINYLSDSSITLPWEGCFDDLVRYLAERIPEDYREQFLNSFSRNSLLTAWAEGKADVMLEHGVCLNHLKKNGWFATKVYFIRDHKIGSDVRILAVSVDITRQRENTVLLQKRYDLTIDNMPGFICKWLIDDDEIRLLEANTRFYEFMHMTEAQAVNRPLFFDFSTPEETKMRNTYLELAREKKDIFYEGRGYRYDGEEIWITISGTYYETQNGKNVYYCIVSDVTDNVLLREKARQDAKELDIAADMSNLLVIKFDVVGNKLHMLTTNKKYMNNVLSQLEGHAPEYALESGVISISSETSFYNAVSSIRQGNESGEIRFAVGKGQTVRWYAGQYRTVYDAIHHPVSAIITLQEEVKDDITATARLIAEFYDETSVGNRKMMIVNLRTDRIEFETENEELSFTDDGIVSFSEAIGKIISDKRISGSCASRCREFLDPERLTALYADGRKDDSMECACLSDEGSEVAIGIRVILQENQFDRSIIASIILSELLPETVTEAADADEAAPADTVGEGAEETKGPSYNVSPKDIFIRTFGYFDVFVNGVPISFAHEKSKEMLAVLVHRRGGYVSTADMISYLWEDEPSTKTTQSRCRQVASRLKHILEENGIEDIVETVNGKRRIIPEKVNCDYFNYLRNKTEYEDSYNGEYMMNYSWGEGILAELSDRDY